MKSNYLKLAMVFIFTIMLSLSFTANAQDVGTISTDSVELVNSAESSTTFEDIVAVLISVVGGLLYLAMFAHMIYVRIKLTPRYKSTYTVEEFRHARIDAGLDRESSDAENQSMAEGLESIVSTWKEGVDPETGNTVYTITKFKHLKAAFEQMNLVIAQAPTDQAVVDELNDYANIIAVNEERHFDGSKVMMWISGIIAAILMFTGMWNISLVMLLSLAVYYFSAMRPTFLLAKAKEGKVGAMNKILIGVFAMIGAAQTVKTTTKYSDGSKDVDYDNSQHLISWFIGIIIIFILAVYLPIWSIFNYLRNYVIYW